MFGFDAETGKESFVAKMAADAKDATKDFVDLGESFKFSEKTYEDFRKAYNQSKNE